MANNSEKISFCIVSMNRLHQLKETLICNLDHYKDKSDIEFILLDYNSKDGMEEWVKENLSQHIGTGLLVYYKTTEPSTFSHSHSKNMAFRLANGEFICSINADHFIGQNFDDYIRKTFKAKPQSFISPYLPPGSKNKYIPPKDVMGKICVRNSDFKRITGFDERFKNYGFEDIDLVKRLENIGIRQQTLKQPEFLKFIEHGDDERVQASKSTIADIYLRQIDPSSSEVIYLNTDFTYDQLTYIRISLENCSDYRHLFKVNKYLYDFAIKDNRWSSGVWKKENQKLILSSGKNEEHLLNEKDLLVDEESNNTYFAIKNFENEVTLNAMRSFMRNLFYMEQNIAKKTIKINKSDFGKGRVYKNFHHEYNEI